MSPRDWPHDDLEATDPEELIDGYKAPSWLPTILDRTDNRKD